LEKRAKKARERKKKKNGNSSYHKEDLTRRDSEGLPEKGGRTPMGKKRSKRPV